ncbi:MAG: hypothetical protein IIW86_03945 [Clostridia bacterium]|nr:hypothetical protein [Clostridia bacterium]
MVKKKETNACILPKGKETYADIVAKVDAHLYNASYDLTAAIFGGVDLTDEQREHFVKIVSNLVHLKNALNDTAER